MYLDVSLSIVLVDGVDGSLCGSNGEVRLAGLSRWAVFGHVSDLLAESLGCVD